MLLLLTHNNNNMKKIFTLFSLVGLLSTTNAQQQVYTDFETIKVAALAEWGGTMDSTAVNPGSNAVNSSSICGMYTRGTDMYDNFKLFPYTKLTDVTNYAVSGGAAPKMMMKVYTNAPAGTRVELQLGAKSMTTYPQGIHSEYTATTTASGAWEVLTFDFVKIPTGSMVNPGDIDKIVVLFNPGTTTTDVWYFDEPTGPELTIIGITENKMHNNSFQSSPNPTTDFSNLKFELKEPGKVNITLYDMLGRPVKSILNENLSAGKQELKIDIQSLPAGSYFYELKNGNKIYTSKMLISK
jgi:hypothetical protein